MRLVIPLAALVLACAFGTARADEPASFALTVRGHQFLPAELTVPAGQRIELKVTNADSTPEEFESTDLRREKVVPAGSTVSVFVGPLHPGSYEFFGDFHPKTARGRLVAR
ncbi:MAG: cupredoxin domain-containing protein [Acetobacteraceae bacterium]